MSYLVVLALFGANPDPEPPPYIILRGVRTASHKAAWPDEHYLGTEWTALTSWGAVGKTVRDPAVRELASVKVRLSRKGRGGSFPGTAEWLRNNIRAKKLSELSFK